MTTGFVRFRAAVIDNEVVAYVEDSGPGIPAEKRDKLFAKFQDSLDVLNQGTGIGLSLCKSLSKLLNIDITLDEEYQSGVEGCPGTRFILSFHTAPMSLDPVGASKVETAESIINDGIEPDESETLVLPEKLDVLFVEDNLVLRKLFKRAIKELVPGWKVDEAANGETCLRLVEAKEYDVIFMDQYMPGVEKTLLGTETVRELRTKGVSSIICGLSANDMEGPFLTAGADAFTIKPFPCEKNALTEELHRILTTKSVV